MNIQTTVAAVKLGEYIRLKDSDSAPVWIRDAYDKATKTYTLVKADDINHTMQAKPTRVVYIGFTY